MRPPAVVAFLFLALMLIHALPATADAQVASQSRSHTWSLRATQQALSSSSQIPATLGRPSATTSVPDGAGGLYIVWPELRNGSFDIFLLRITNTGAAAAGWPADGLPVCAAPGNQIESAIFPDGSNGVLVGWLDARDDFLGIDIYAQRVSSAGAVQWAANGIKVLDGGFDIDDVAATGDGSGGFMLAWAQGATELDVRAKKFTGAGALAAGWSASGTIVCSATGDQFTSRIVEDGAGGAYVAWEDERGATTHIYMQRMNGSGVAQWTPNGVQVDASIAGVSRLAITPFAGTALAFWVDATGPILGQRVDGTGALNWSAAGETMRPVSVSPATDLLATPHAGGAIVTWEATGITGFELGAQSVDVNGTIQWPAAGASVYAGSSEDVAILPDGGGGAYFVWNDFQTGPLDLFAQRVNSAGTPQWAASGLAVSTGPGEETQPIVADDGFGALLVSWWDDRSGDIEVYTQKINALGTIQLAPNGTASYTNPGVQVRVGIVQAGDGGALVGWNEKRGGQYDVRVTKMDASGTTVGGPLLTEAAGNQQIAGAIDDGLGGAIVAWYDSISNAQVIYAQRINASAVPQWVAGGVLVSSLSGEAEAVDMVSDGAGGAIFAWQDWRNPGTDIYAQRITSTGVVAWTPGGVAICNDPNTQTLPRLAPDGSAGATIAWSDLRNFQAQVYAQRVNAAGAAQWAANGVLIATYAFPSFVQVSAAAPGAAGEAVFLMNEQSVNITTFVPSSLLHLQKVDGAGAAQWGAGGTTIRDTSGIAMAGHLLSNGAGGAYAAWSDGRGSPFDIYAQLVDASGNAQWSTHGNVVCNAANWQDLGGMTRSGSDIFLTWADARSGSEYDVYAQRMNSSGLPVWALNGVVVSDAARGQYFAFIAPWKTASPERLYIAWTDTRGGQERLAYAERLDFSGLQQWTANGVTDVQVALAESDADVDRVRLVWYGPRNLSATVYRRAEGTDWSSIGSVQADGSGALVFEDDDVDPGESYGYRLGVFDDDQERFLGEAWVQVPSAFQLALGGLTPNPAAGELVVAFTLPRNGSATLELIDVSGRRVREYSLNGIAAGRHTFRLDGQRPAPGIYFLKLSQGSASVTSRAAVIR